MSQRVSVCRDMVNSMVLCQLFSEQCGTIIRVLLTVQAEGFAATPRFIGFVRCSASQSVDQTSFALGAIAPQQTIHLALADTKGFGSIHHGQIVVFDSVYDLDSFHFSVADV